MLPGPATAVGLSNTGQPPLAAPHDTRNDVMTVAPQILAAGFSPLSFDPAAFALTIITILGLMFILAKFAWGPILSSVEAREKRIEDAIADAEKDRQTAEGVLADYRERVRLLHDHGLVANRGSSVWAWESCGRERQFPAG